MDNTKEYAEMCTCQEIKDKFDHLPGQDEIQNLIFTVACEYRMLQDFAAWLLIQRSKDINNVRKTLEKLWLEYYMWQDHNKLWVKGKWVNEG